MPATRVELNDALLTEEHRGGMLSKEPSRSTLQRELGRWKNMTKSEKIETYVRLGVGWPLLLLRVRQAQLKDKKLKKKAESIKESNRNRRTRRLARKAACEAAIALLKQNVSP